ncbi:hypothetical protein TCAL_03394 [Tigriopus californicus]|uniref:Biogenesis of lysosome-related organelles complex 1 subunit 5 n=1 Tax=Tigriopus californicus TaxID=6832 RepID=A0A553P4U1_TIGCA|nr:hypothetical protein TCAL_03394 [Tigriopus californicus]
MSKGSSSSNVMEIMQAKMQEEVEALQTLQKQSSQALTARQTLDSQLNENQLVKEEMDALEEGAHVFKLIGPALVRQAVPEAQGNGEVRHFVREFEDQRGDREVERVFRVLERVTELRDEHVDQVQVAAQAALPGLQAKLARTRTLYQHILDPNRTLEIAKASENSKHIRAREWQEFEQDLDLQRKRVTEAYQAQAIDLQRQYADLEDQFPA